MEKVIRTNIVIDDDLMKEAVSLSGCKSRKETVEEALKLLITMKKQAWIRKFRGKLKWEGDLNRMRSDK